MAQVKIRLYDISQGMARIMSPRLIGKQIDGIWHSAIEVFGSEYFFGGGICKEHPGSTPFGTPVQFFDMGVTTRTQGELEAYLLSISHRYGIGTYHLLNHNCNNFTDEVCLYLVGQNIPAHITGLPAELLSTPLGRQFEPMINSMMQMQTSMFGGAAPASDTVGHADIFAEGIIEVTSIAQLTQLTAERALVIFWSPMTDDIYEALDDLSQLIFKIKVGCVDLSRYPSVATVKAPYVKLYEFVSPKQHEVIKEQQSYVGLLELVSARGLQVIGRKTQIIEYCQGTLDQPKKYLADHIVEARAIVDAPDYELLQKWVADGKLPDNSRFIGVILKMAKEAQPNIAYLDIIKQVALKEAFSTCLLRTWPALFEVVAQSLISSDQRASGLALKILCNLFSQQETRTFLAAKAAELSAVILPRLEDGKLNVLVGNFYTNLLNSLPTLVEDEWGNV